MPKDSRDHILEVSLLLFLQKSFKAVTMKEIVERTGLSKGAFYHYFESKEQVFEEVIHHYYKGLFVQKFSKFSHDSLKAFCEDYLKDIDEKFFTVRKIGLSQQEDGSLNHYLLIFDAISILPSFRKLYEEDIQKQIKAWKKIVSIARKNGEITTTLPDEQLATMLVYLGDGFGMNFIFKNDMSNVQKFRKELRKLWTGFYSLLTP